MYIGTFNVRGLVDPHRQYLLDHALKNIKWDIIGLSEVKKEGTEILEKEEYVFMYHGERSGTNGIGFIIKKKFKENIVDFKPISDRVARLSLKLGNSKTLNLIQVYFPTGRASWEEIEKTYTDISAAVGDCKEPIILGDFNAKIGLPMAEDKFTMGPWGYGTRNERGSKLLEFCRENQLYIWNSHFKKKPKQRWTWRSPDQVTRNEIDFFVANKNERVQNLQVINTQYPSDHRLLRCTYKYATNLQENKKSRKTFTRKKAKLSPIEAESLKNIFRQLTENGNDSGIQERYDEIIAKITKSLSMLPQTCDDKNIDHFVTPDIENLIHERIELQNKTNKNKLEKRRLSKLYKEIKKKIKKAMKQYKFKVIEESLEKRGSVKLANKQLQTSISWIPALHDKKGGSSTNRIDLLDIASDFYKNLYTETAQLYQSKVSNYTDDEVPPPFLEREIQHAIESLRLSKSPGEDGITNEILKAIVEPLTPLLTYLFNEIISQKIIPQQWETAVIRLLYKKGDPKEIGNYRPISLLQTIYKLFTQLILKRISQTLDFNQPREQAGFRAKFSTTDHMFTLTQIVEKFSEFKKTIYIAFVDYAKAFDSILHDPLWHALKEQGVPKQYVEILKEIYSKSKGVVKLERKGDPFVIKRGVRQGDPVSPKLFTALLEYTFRRLNWDSIGLNINGEQLNHLRFADDIVLLSESHEELQFMLSTLDEQSRACGLAMNPDKTCILTNGEQKDTLVQGKLVNYVQNYVYLGQNIAMENWGIKEVERRVAKAWNKYWSLKDVFKSKLPLGLKKKAFDSVVLPTLLYGCQTWPLTKTITNKLQVFQRSAERSMLGLKLTDRVRALDIRHKTKLIDAVEMACSLKWRWAGHISRVTDGRWSERVLHWQVRDTRRGRGRPRRRWVDDIVQLAGRTWTRLAADRDHWRRMEEAYVQQWTSQTTII